MSQLLDNPVFNALNTYDSHLGSGTDHVKFFDEEVSPFAGFQDGYIKGFDDLHQLLPPDRKILYATRKKLTDIPGWKLISTIEGLQFKLENRKPSGKIFSQPVPLDARHADEMVKLAALTKPGPFNKRTIEFGSYFGIFENDRLAAMTGQRLHVPGFSEVSAVCTHPDFLGKGYATILLEQQLDIIFSSGRKSFLHVRSDNERAISIYERLGLRKNGPMNFYYLKKA